MRLLPRTVLISLAAVLVAAPVASQQPDSQISPRSLELLKQGEAHLAAGRFIEADDALETALAVDPRNRAAFISLARVAHRQKLFGQAIRFTNKALALEPNDVKAIALQGEAMMGLGAVARAKENLARLQKLCPNGCAQVTELSAAIGRGPNVASANPPSTPKTN